MVSNIALQNQNVHPLKLQYVQVLRGLAALFVVLFHTSLNNIVYLNVSPILNNIYNYGWLGVQFFFVLSGFIITYIHLPDLEKKINTKRFIKKRFIRIYPIYWVIATVILLYYVFIKKDTAGTTVKIQDFNDFIYVLKCYLLLPLNSHKHNFIDIAWTLSYEILFYFAFAICIKIGFKKAVYFYFLWASVVLLKAYTHSVDFLPYSNFVFNILILYFLMGCFVAYIIKNNKVFIKSIWFMLTLTVLLTCLYLYAHLTGIIPTQISINIIYNYLFILIFSLILFWAASFKTKEIQQKSVSPLFILLGDASYSLYLTHTPVIMLLYKMLQFFGKKFNILISVFSSNLLFVIIVIICVFVGIIVHLYVEKPILVFLSKKNLEYKH